MESSLELKVVLFLFSQMHCNETLGTRVVAYNLVLYVQIPETSGLDVSLFSSPVVTLGRYEGLSSDTEAPNWTWIPTGIPVEFRQPRNAMAAVFAELAFWPENAAVVSPFVSFQTL